MEICRKKSLLAIFIVATVAIVIAILFGCGGIAYAENATLVHPVDNYIQSKSVDLIGADENVVATFDKTEGVLTVSGTKRLSLLVDGTVNGIYVLDGKILLDCADGLKFISLAAEFPAVTDSGISSYTYLTTYGNRIYAHYIGRVSVYDSSFNLIADYTDTVFNNLPVLVSDGDTIYSFVAETGSNKVYVYDVATTDSQKRTNGYFVESASLGSVIFVYNGANVLLVPTDELDAPVETSLTNGNFSAVGNDLYVANGEKGYSVYTLNENKTALVLKTTYSMSGDGLDKLNSPSDVNFANGKLYVADKGNDRIIVKDGNVISAISVDYPEKIAVSKNEIFSSSENTVSVITNGEVYFTHEFDVNVIDLCFDGNLYVLTENGVGVLAGGKLYDYFAVENGVAITSDGFGNLYVLTENEVVALSSKTRNFLLSFSFGESITPADLAVDYAGNVFLLSSDGIIYKYSWKSVVESNLGSTTLQNTAITVDGNGYSFTANSVCLSDVILLSVKENAIVSVDADFVTADGYSPIYAEIADGATAVLRSATDGAFITSDLNSARSVRTFEAGVVLCYDNGDGNFIVNIAGTNYFLYNSVEAVATPVESNDYRTNKDAKAYLSPDGNGEITIANGTPVTLVDDACNLDGGKWWRMEKDGATYYIARADVSVYVAPAPEEPEKPKAVYGRAKADRAGGTVNIYSSPDDGSEVLWALTDGVKVEVLETLDDYYLVGYGDVTGYVKIDQIELDGLTTVQIIAIVLSVVVVLASVLVFLVTYQTKRKMEEDENKKSAK